MAKRGASETVVEQVVGEVFESGEEEMLREAVSRWVSRNRWDRQRLVRHLERRGFSIGGVLRITGEYEPEESADDVGRRW